MKVWDDRKFEVTISEQGKREMSGTQRFLMLLRLAMPKMRFGAGTYAVTIMRVPTEKKTVDGKEPVK